MSLLKKKSPILKFERNFALTKWCYELVLKKSIAIPLVVIFSVIVGIVGSSKLAVENSFIDYFKKSTEIYKGMAVIDQKLGGTTPLDIVIDFKETPKEEESQDDEFADEFANEGEQYWFTNERTAIIRADRKSVV